MELIERISQMIAPVLEEHQCYEDEIVYEKENNEWYLRIFIEKINGTLDMDTCVAVSEKISELLDLNDPIQGEYYLEVSSPGAEKVLKDFDQVRMSIGKYVYIKFKNPIKGLGQDEVYGTIEAVNDRMISLEYRVKNIKKNIEVDYDWIRLIRLAVKF